MMFPNTRDVLFKIVDAREMRAMLQRDAKFSRRPFYGDFYDSSTGTMISPCSRMRAEYQSRRNRGAVPLSVSRGAIGEPKVKALALAIYARLVHGRDLRLLHFSPTEREKEREYGVLAVIRS